MGWFTPVDSVRLWITIKNDGKIKWSVKLISPVHYETQVKNERATWLELTWDFEGMVTLLSEQHMCKKEIEVWWGGGVYGQTRTEPRLQCWNPVLASSGH